MGQASPYLRRGKYLHVAERLSRRILSGDYHLHGLPAERELAEEVGVSHVTVRKAIQKLLDEGLLRRETNGRLEVQRGDATGVGVAQIALVVPAWQSAEVSNWYLALAELGTRHPCSVRLVYYAHWDDPALLSALERFDGSFFLPVPEPMPAYFLPAFLKLDRPIAVLDVDWSQHGVPSVQLYPPVFVQKLLDHLAEQGHERIDCLNVQPTDTVIAARMAQWQIWMAARGFEGELVDEPVQAYTHAIAAAYAVMSRRIEAGQAHGTALLCTTEPAAAGAMRAMIDHGIEPGRDVAVCTIDGEMRAAYHMPSLTSLEAPDPKPYLGVALAWMLDGNNRRWTGSLRVQPGEIAAVARESTTSFRAKVRGNDLSP
ncbi:MAG: GntR family transcriptional regulator [Phycisphaeraceae bacterium]